jgi:hypothetical protein
MLIATPPLTIAAPRLAESGSRRLSDSLSFLLNIQKQTPQLSESENRSSITNISENLKPKSEWLER